MRTLLIIALLCSAGCLADRSGEPAEDQKAAGTESASSSVAAEKPEEATVEEDEAEETKAGEGRYVDLAPEAPPPTQTVVEVPMAGPMGNLEGQNARGDGDLATRDQGAKDLDDDNADGFLFDDRERSGEDGAREKKEGKLNVEKRDKNQPLAAGLTVLDEPADDPATSEYRAGLAQQGKKRPEPESFIPETFIPDTCYVENTYLGGNAAYLEQLRRLDEALAPWGNPHRLASPPPQDLDPPDSAGMALSAALSTRWFDQPQRVFLQVGLRGSERYGWRRPPLEMVLVVDGAALTDGPEAAVATVRALLRQLGEKDSLAIVLAGESPKVVAELSRLRHLRTEVLPQLDVFEAPRQVGAHELGQALGRAGELLRKASLDRSTMPGTQTVLILTRGAEPQRVSVAQAQVHTLTVQGVVSSVIQLDQGGAWWAVANAGHGNYHQAEAGDDGIGAAVAEELDSLARVVARLLRLNVRLAPGVKAIRVLGSRVLDQETVRQVKAREVATDRQLSRSLGIVADRGDDDDGIQTVIPYFYGGDAHVVVLELWVEKPGKVADIALRYKDMVAMDNATARTAVHLRNVPREPTGEQAAVAEILPAFTLAEALDDAAALVLQGQPAQAVRALQAASTVDADGPLVRQLTALVQQTAYQRPNDVAAALRLAARRKIGGNSPPR